MRGFFYSRSAVSSGGSYSETGDTWTSGWSAGGRFLWTDTPKQQEGGEAEPCPHKRQRTHISHSQGQGDLPNYTGAERFLEGQKGRGHHPIVGDINLLIDLFAGIHLGWDARTQIGRSWDKPNMDSEASKAKMTGQGKLGRNAPYKWSKLPRAWFSLSVHMYSFFLPNKHFVCFTTFRLYWEFISTQLMAWGPVTGHWSLVVWKVKVTQSCLSLCDPMDYTVHGIFQVRILEWVAFSFSRASSQPRHRP